MISTSRLQRELKDANRQAGKDADIRLEANEDQIFRWRASIRAPDGTPFEGCRFDVTLRVPSDYPIAPPTAQFETKIFHPNVKWNTGEICIDILKDRWSPAWTLMSVCRAIQALMGDPFADSPLNCDAGNLVRGGDMKGYEELARHYARIYAGAPERPW
jgi:peroxin-4